MADFYTNLPPKDKDRLQKSIDKLTTDNYQSEYQFNVGEYDSTVAFFCQERIHKNVCRIHSICYTDAGKNR